MSICPICRRRSARIVGSQRSRVRPRRREAGAAMRRVVGLTLVGVALLLATPAGVSYVAFEQITVAGTAIGFTATLITPAGRPESNATVASCRLRTAQISFTYSGT